MNNDQQHERPFIVSGYLADVEPLPQPPLWRVMLRFLGRGLLADFRHAVWERWQRASCCDRRQRKRRRQKRDR